MAANSPSSRKQKGQSFQKKIVELILEYFPSLTSRDVRSVPSGVPGVDIRLSEAAYKVLGLAIECKRTESLSIWKCMEQAESEAREGLPVLVFKRNRSKTYCCFEFEELLKILKGD